jgi:membrane protease YdiL (CAAX protease family)
MRDWQYGRVLVRSPASRQSRAETLHERTIGRPGNDSAGQVRRRATRFRTGRACVFLLIILVVAVIPFPLDLETLAGALLIVGWARASRTPLSELGLVRPQSWAGGLLLGIGLGVAVFLAMKAVVMPLLGTPAVNPGIAHLIGSPKRIIVSIVYMIVSAGICEEIVFRGYLFERLGRLFSDASARRLPILLLTATFFGLVHYQSGIYAMVNAGIGGIILGAIYLINRKRLWMVMVTHAANDLCALAIGVFHLQAAVAHSVVR